MPKGKHSLPDTLKRSSKKAQETYLKTLDSAEDTYDSEESKHRVAFAAVKHSFKKQGDRWVPKDKKGPSDPQAARSGKDALRSNRPTAGGKDVGTTKDELMRQARKLDIPGRSKMNKDELAQAVGRRTK